MTNQQLVAVICRAAEEQFAAAQTSDWDGYPQEIREAMLAAYRAGFGNGYVYLASRIAKVVYPSP